MNQVLFDFYSGKSPNTDGLYFSDILKMSDEEFEAGHTFIQWLFPTKEPSKFNKDAPLLDKETIDKMFVSPECEGNLWKATIRFMNFLTNTEANWITPNNHNFLRITRVISSLTQMESEPLAFIIFNLVMYYASLYPEIINTNTIGFWEGALV